MFIDPETRWDIEERYKKSRQYGNSNSGADNSGYGALIIGGVIVVCALVLWLFH